MLQWITLEKEETEKIIKAVRDSGEPMLFSAATSEAKCARLPFYRNYLLYRITNYASLPSFSFDYLGYGKRFFYLDGSFEPVFGVNKSGNFFLSEENLADYAEFYFRYVRSEDGEIKLLRSLHDHAGLDSLPPSELDDLGAHDWSATASRDDKTGKFRLSAVLDNMGALVKAVMEIDESGRINIIDQKLLSSLGPELATGTNTQ